MKKGMSLMFINQVLRNKLITGLTIGNSYVVKDFGTIKTYSWIVVDDDDGFETELDYKNFKNVEDAREDKLNLFEYSDPGSMATVGKRKAVVDLPKFSFSGRLAWFTWMFLHLMLILTVRNKVAIFFNWAHTYFTNDSSLRIIVRPTKKDFRFNLKQYRRFPKNREKEIEA